MIYLDYAATTPVANEVLDVFNKVTMNTIGNPNSLHRLGLEAERLIADATNKVSETFKVSPTEIIYTSGATEANNLAIKGITGKYKGKHIITTRFEHSSIYGPISALEKHGYEVDFVETNENGLVDLIDLKALLRDDTVLVTIASVNSEIGIKQPINEIGNLLANYPNCFFHVDLTQSVGKEQEIDLTNIDLASCSAHKFYGIKGIGILIKKDRIKLEPLIHGGKSTTIYRSGTPTTALICSFAKALELVNNNTKEKYSNVLKYNEYLRANLEHYDKVKINSPKNAIPHILNVSILGANPEEFSKALEQHDVYVSTQTACHTGSDTSLAVLALTNDQERANSAIRISLSHLTNQAELDSFLKAFNACYQELEQQL